MAKRILRPAESQAKLSVGHTKFWEFIKTGKLRPPVRLGPKSVGHPENEIDDLIDQLVAERDSGLKLKVAPGRACPDELAQPESPRHDKPARRRGQPRPARHDVAKARRHSGFNSRPR